MRMYLLVKFTTKTFFPSVEPREPMPESKYERSSAREDP
jgi:hypothetical protein